MNSLEENDKQFFYMCNLPRLHSKLMTFFFFYFNFL